MNKAYELARDEIGVTEWKEGSNPVVLKYFDDAGHKYVKDDATAWCAAFVGAMLKRAGLPNSGKLNARSYLNIGTPVALADAEPGDIVVFWREREDSWKGHVGFYVSHNNLNVLTLGGNQANAVNEKNYPVKQVLGVRRIDGGKRKPVQSKTLQAAAVAATATVAATAAETQGWAEGYAPYVFGAIVLLCLAVIVRERLKKWAKGIR